MIVRIDGLGTEAEVHAAFRQASGVEWYGGNLDALFDLLVGVVDPPITIHWTNAARSRAGIGERFDRLLVVILDVVAYRQPGQIRFLLES